MNLFRKKPSLTPTLDAIRRRRWRRWTAVFLVVLLFALGTQPAYRWGKRWRARTLAAEAAGLIKEKRYPEAVEKVRVALQLAPAEPASRRAAALLVSLSGAPGAADHWKALLSLPGVTAQDRRHAALVGLGTHRLDLAEEQVILLLQASPDDLASLELATQLALQKNEPAVALAFAERLLAHDPHRAFARLNRAQLLLFKRDVAEQSGAASPLAELQASMPAFPPPPPATAEDVRAELRGALDDPAMRVSALRLLIEDARRRGAQSEAVACAEELVGGPGWTFDDQLLRLTVRKEAQSGRLDPSLPTVLELAGRTSADALAMAKWLLDRQEPQRLLDWLPTLPEPMQSEEPLRLLRADACAALGRWSEAEAGLRQGHWPRFDVVRRASLARSVREQQQKTGFHQEWDSLLQDTKDNREGMMALLRLASGWKWVREQEQLLWKILERFPREQWAANSLVNGYLAAGDTPGLRKVAEWLLERDPQNPVHKNNAAILSLLLSQQDEKALRLAREAHKSAPANPLFACTYAYALFRSGAPREARALMESLPPAALENPSTAAYWAVILREDGEDARAEKYAKLARTGQLLPEERKLVE